MGKVVVNLSVSADGFFEGPDGDISWGLVDEEVHAHFNEVLGPMSYFVEGRVVYEMMEAHWPTADQQPDSTEAEREFARIWRETPKVVYSRTLDASGPTRRSSATWSRPRSRNSRRRRRAICPWAGRRSSPRSCSTA